ncbi:hypothetical protein LNKW23_17460 [Paralimibaculum aggregatum]|uniref:Class I SAM-dependent methyltransferase n=1 Tax=Paralimibaculum aggregatum TaxID=3036245 RepID=A0ABQ6LGV8_9RHOB|nr:class I SAM-dependent methyltransferase [Limibaculum sp. NKW23]GMG82533.1 hypothetical protein LNKW23_17460 [Limibaculum sp. NKW23]
MIQGGEIRRRARRISMGLSTLLGRPRGFFSPFRYAAGIAPTAYPELEAVFAAAAPEIEAVLEAIAAHGDRLASLAGPAPEPRWNQQWFPGLDGAAAYALVRMTGPRRILEVGSGHSTRFLARAVRDAGGAPTGIVCIDPQPRAALGGLPVTWHRRLLGAEDIPAFAALEPGDIAFFDSSHLLWPGSDVDLIVNRILPALRPGVLVHLHDIFLPDPYPAEWDWRGYTEQLGLGGWLAGGGMRLRFASRYASTRLGATARPGIAGRPFAEARLASSLWLERR